MKGLNAYSILIGRNDYSSSSNDILFNLEYYDNKEKTIEDLKEYISDLLDSRYCPCFLKLYHYKGYSDYYFKMSDLEEYKYENAELLSNIYRSGKIYVIINKCSACYCSEDFKKNYKLSKKRIIEKISQEKAISKSLQQERDHLRSMLKEKDKEISNLNYDIDKYKRNKIKYDKKAREDKYLIDKLKKENEIKEKDNDVYQNKLIKSQHNENYLTKLKKSNEDIINDLNEKLKKSESNASSQSGIIKELTDQQKISKNEIISLKKNFNEKSEILEKNKKELNIKINELKKLNDERFKLENENKKKEKLIQNLKNDESDLKKKI